MGTGFCPLLEARSLRRGRTLRCLPFAYLSFSFLTQQVSHAGHPEEGLTVVSALLRVGAVQFGPNGRRASLLQDDPVKQRPRGTLPDQHPLDPSCGLILDAREYVRIALQCK